jgi:hypothetical protein
MAFVQHDSRKRIETAGSWIARRWPNTIHAVTARGELSDTNLRQT